MFKRISSSAVLSSHYVCMYNHYFFYQANNALDENREREKEKKKESEDIERSIGRTTVLP